MVLWTSAHGLCIQDRWKRPTQRVGKIMKRIGIFLASLLWILAALRVHSRTLSVEKWGSDSPYCGAAGDPCATINQAIDSADPGNTIRVGPGFTETSTATVISMTTARNRGSADSRTAWSAWTRTTSGWSPPWGAAHMVINGNGSVSVGVYLQGKGVTFGRKKRDFTVRNTAVRNYDGFFPGDTRRPPCGPFCGKPESGKR